MGDGTDDIAGTSLATLRSVPILPSDLSQQVTTALREAEEEIGLPRDTVEVLGLDDDFSTSTGYVITPVVGWLLRDFTLTTNPAASALGGILMANAVNGVATFSFTHSHDAATAIVAALDKNASGALNIVDDNPAQVNEWLPALAEILGAKKPSGAPARLGPKATSKRALAASMR